ncbi:hypothetical protein MK079_02460 [Candidatus Gracilibacteria bacterium]|nr:hypothetical protein [Candidatus Gracilibacteria bacterium]
MSETANLHYQEDIQQQLEQSETDSTTRFYTLQEINRANKILEDIKDDNPQYFKEAQKRYESFRLSAIEMIQSENKITQKELNDLRGQIHHLEGSIDTKGLEIIAAPIELINAFTGEKNILENLQENLNQIENQFIKKDIEQEIQRLKNGGKKTKWTTYLDTIAERVDNNFVPDFMHNHAQNKIIAEVLGTRKGYNSEYIQGYNNTLSNYLIKTKDFEAQLKSGIDIKQINSKALANYITYLSETGTTTLPQFIKKFGPNQLFELGKLWGEQGKSGDYGIAKTALEKSGLKNVVHLITMFGSTQNFLTGIQNIKDDPEALEVGLQYYKNNTESIKEKFNDDMREAFEKAHPDMDENEIEAKIKLFNTNMKEIIIRLQSGEVNILAVTKAFDVFIKDNNLEGLNSIEQSQVVMDRNKNSLQALISRDYSKLYQLKKTGGSQEEIRLVEKNISILELNFQKLTVADKQLRDKDFQKVYKGEITYEEFHTKKMQEDEEYAKLIQTIEKKQTDYGTEIKVPQSKNSTQGNELYTTSEYTLDETGNIPTLTSQTGEIIRITPEEARNMRGNPEAQESIIQFKQDLDDIGMGFFFQIRQDVYDSMPAIGFDTNDGDYLSKNEMRIFISTILLSVQDKLDAPIPSTQASYGEFKEKVKILNKQTLITGQKEVDLNGYSYIEHIFREKFFPNDAFIMEKSKFQEAIK